MGGVKAVVETPRGVGVIADSYWTALQAKKALKIDWDETEAEKRSSAELWKEYKQLAKGPLHAVRNDGDVATAFKEADKKAGARVRISIFSARHYGADEL